MNRFFVPQTNFDPNRVIMTKSQAHQIRNVLRLQPGDRITVLDNTGYEYEVTITNLTCSNAVGRIESKTPCTTEPKIQITLYQSLLKRDKFEWVLQKCTEVGVTTFVPVVTSRSIVQKAGKITNKHLDRWRKIISEAAEQSARGRLPILNPPAELNQALKSLQANTLNLIAQPDTATPRIKEILRRKTSLKYTTINLFTGPEGGFTPDEISLAKQYNATVVSLGKRILRTETASVVAAAIVLYELDEAISPRDKK